MHSHKANIKRDCTILIFPQCIAEIPRYPLPRRSLIVPRVHQLHPPWCRVLQGTPHPLWRGIISTIYTFSISALRCWVLRLRPPRPRWCWRIIPQIFRVSWRKPPENSQSNICSQLEWSRKELIILRLFTLFIFTCIQRWSSLNLIMAILANQEILRL